MSISYTYTSIRTEIQRWLEDSFDDFTTSLDDILAKAEERCLRDLGLEIFDATDTSKSTTGGNSSLTLADDAILLRNLWVNDEFVEPRTESYVNYYNEISTNAQPLYWCQTGEDTITLAPTPDAAYSTRQRVLKRPTALSSSNANSWLGDHAGDLLFAACMMLGEWFDKAPEDQAAAEAEYMRLLGPAKVELRHVARKDY